MTPKQAEAWLILEGWRPIDGGKGARNLNDFRLFELSRVTGNMGMFQGRADGTYAQGAYDSDTWDAAYVLKIVEYVQRKS